MDYKSQYRRIFGVGPTGVMVTIIIWMAFYVAEQKLNIPAITIHPTLRMVLLIIFLLDAIYLLGGSMLTLKVNQRGKKLITTGPYQFVRHPIYSAFIYSGTGALSMWQYSWLILFSVIPLALFWSWHVDKEEQYMLEKFGKNYRDYMDRTGQFFPSFKTMKKPEKN